ncbi:hypothetical protein [Polynucleobacter sphagniphilus]|uniref:hypothetical protein n=1 Tax=Polynucleobacter sphagniphilus TaxID=1743169 RepID=UPI0024749BBE|nr:hypothetical protein [Polynucleobacter sphagniphilus]
MNDILLGEQNGFSVSAVLWNVFPDLLIRNSRREPLFGLEVKALHTAAEEKSANLATPLSLIARNEDFLVILLWGWVSTEKQGVSITYPHIHAVDVFDAWLLAKIRDYGWMFNHGNRIKGIDLCSPVINGALNNYKAEEGNLGKLMRIGLPSDAPSTLSDFDAMKAENSHYESFLQLILALGLRETFIDVCELDGATPDISKDQITYPNICCIVSRAIRKNGGTLLLIAGPAPVRWLNQSEMANETDVTHCLWLGQKLNWVVYEKLDDSWINKGEGDKPDSDLDAIQLAIGRNALS